MTEEVKRVGYGSPPIYSQWQKGQSGNPKGRKKGHRNLRTDLADELGKTVAVTENGVRRTITKQQALVAKLINGSIQGDPRLSLALLRLLNNLLPDTEAVPDTLSISDEEIMAEFLAKHQSPPKGE
jgi:hypothetical protein